MIEAVAIIEKEFQDDFGTELKKIIEEWVYSLMVTNI